MSARSLARAKFIHHAFPAHHVPAFYPENRLRPQGAQVKQGRLLYFGRQCRRQKCVQECFGFLFQFRNLRNNFLSCIPGIGVMRTVVITNHYFRPCETVGEIPRQVEPKCFCAIWRNTFLHGQRGHGIIIVYFLFIRQFTIGAKIVPKIEGCPFPVIGFRRTPVANA